MEHKDTIQCIFIAVLNVCFTHKVSQIC